MSEKVVPPTAGLLMDRYLQVGHGVINSRVALSFSVQVTVLGELQSSSSEGLQRIKIGAPLDYTTACRSMRLKGE